MNLLKIIAFITLLSACASAQANRYMAQSASDINSRTWNAGDTILMQNGQWISQAIHFKGNGTKESPAVLLAETPGKVLMKGSSYLTIDGSYLEVSGLSFKGSDTAPGNKAVVETTVKSSYCRITDIQIDDYNTANVSDNVKWISIKGSEHRIDHCYLANKRNMGTTMVVWLVSGQKAGHRIDHNHFGTRVPQLDSSGKEINGQETIRIGDSGTSLIDAFCTVENNFFEKCDGEVEVISNKSCGNTYRNNLFFECKGTLCLRHGHRCTVDGNIFLANGFTGTGGIRIMGEDHTVVNNYLYQVPGDKYRAAISLTKGNENTELFGYSQVKNAFIAFNTFIDCRYAIDVAVGTGESQTECPAGTVIRDNHVYNTSSKNNYPIYIRDNNGQIAYENNLYNQGKFGNTEAASTSFIRIGQPKMNRQAGEYALFEPEPASDLYKYTTSRKVQAKTDIRGRERNHMTISGCSQSNQDISGEIPSPENTGVSWINKVPSSVYRPTTGQDHFNLFIKNNECIINTDRVTHLSVFDTASRIIMNRHLSEGSHSFSFPFESGLYFFSFSGSNGEIRQVKKVYFSR